MCVYSIEFVHTHTICTMYKPLCFHDKIVNNDGEGAAENQSLSTLDPDVDFDLGSEFDLFLLCLCSSTSYNGVRTYTRKMYKITHMRRLKE